LNLLASKENIEDVVIRLEKSQKEGLANIHLILEKVEALKEQVSTDLKLITPPVPLEKLTADRCISN